MTCGQVLSWKRTGPFLVTNVGCRRCSFRCISLICWAGFSNVTFSPGFRKLQDSDWHQDSDWQQSTQQWLWPLLSASLALGSTSDILLGSTTELVAAGCCIKSTFLLHITIPLRNVLLLLCRRRHLKMTIFSIFGLFMRHPLIKLFHLSDLLQMPNNCRTVDVKFFGNSHVVVRRPASTVALSCVFPPPAGHHWAPHLQGSQTTTTLHIH